MQRLETHLHTQFSFLDGVGTPKEYITKAKELGMPALFITDHGTATGVFDFYVECKKSSIIPIIGVELYVANDINDTYVGKNNSTRLNRHHLIIYAKNEIGLQNLYKIVSSGWENWDKKPIVLLDYLFQNKEGLVVTSACIASAVTEKNISRFINEFGQDFYLEIQPLDLTNEWDDSTNKFKKIDFNPQTIYNKKVLELSKTHNVKLLVTMDVHYPDKDYKLIQDVFILSSFSGKNGWHFSTENHYLMNNEQCWNEFVKYGHDKYFSIEQYNDAIVNSYEILEKCKDLKLEKPQKLFKFPYKEHRFYSGESDSAETLIMKTIKNGSRIKEINKLDSKDKYYERLFYEMSVLKQKDFLDYFLVVEDIINWNQKNGYLTGVGRGCLVGDTKVYTKEGYKRLKDIKVGDEVLTHTGEYKKVLNTMNYDIDETLLQIKTSFGVNGDVMTKDHKVLGIKKGETNKKWYKACELKKGDLLFTPWVKNIKIEDIKKYEDYLSSFELKIYNDADYINVKSLKEAYEIKESLLYLHIPSSISVFDNLYQVRLFDSENYLITEEGYYGDIINIEEKNDYKKVYDITVEEDASYVTENYTVHNSAAGSLLGYLLGIHHIDPIKYDLLFERFYDASRADVPDIDCDYEHQQKTIEYIINKYGQNRVAMVGAWQICKMKTALKDAYRVIKTFVDKEDYNFAEINEITNKITDTHPEIDELSYFNKLLDPESEVYNKKLHKLIMNNPKIEEVVFKIIGKTKVLKVHPSGVVVSREDINKIVPIWINKPKSENIYCAEFPLQYCEQSGLIKFDILSLTTLVDINNCIKLIKQNLGIELDIYNLNVEDTEVYEAFKKGDTDTVFQFNTFILSKACKDIKVDSLKELSIINAIVRPGPLEAGFLKTYIGRKFNILSPNERYDQDGKKVKVEYTHPLLEEITKDSHGLFCFQEDVMKIFELLGGFNRAEQNVVRKATAKKDKAKLDSCKDKFRKYATTVLQPTWNDHEVDLFFKDLDGFAQYSFCKAHSLAYSYLGYVCQYLKVKYPNEWWSAVLQNATENDVNIVRNRMKNFIMPIDINYSTDKFTLQGDKIRTPFRYMKGIGENGIKNIVDNRPYKDFDDFLNKINRRSVNISTITNLVVIGAFDNIDKRSKQDLICHCYNSFKRKIPNEILSLDADKLLMEKMKSEADPLYVLDLIGSFPKLFNSECIKISSINGCILKNNTPIMTGGKIRKIFRKKTKNDKDFIRMTIADAGYEIEVVVWSEKLYVYDKLNYFKEGNIVEVSGMINLWNNNKSIILQEMRVINL